MAKQESTARPRPVTWTLSLVLAIRGIRTATELHRRLGDVMGDDTPSVEQVRRLASKTPDRLTLRTLAGLCEVLDVEPGDLLVRAGRIEYDEVWTMTPNPENATKLLDAIKRSSRARAVEHGLVDDYDQLQQAADDPALEDARRRPLEPVVMWHTLADFGEGAPHVTIPPSGLQFFDTEEDLAAAISLPLEPATATNVGGFGGESDWLGMATGYGREHGRLGTGGWLITFAMANPNADTGHLIGREFDPGLDGGRTGRCVLIRSPWSSAHNNTEFHRAIDQGWWTPHESSGSGDLDTLHDRLTHGISTI